MSGKKKQNTMKATLLANSPGRTPWTDVLRCVRAGSTETRETSTQAGLMTDIAPTGPTRDTEA